MSEIGKNKNYNNVEKEQVIEATNSSNQILTLRNIAEEIIRSIDVRYDECVITLLIRWLLFKLTSDLVLPGEKYYVLKNDSTFSHLQTLIGLELYSNYELAGSEYYRNFKYEPVAKGIVFFDKDGNKIETIKSNYRFEAWVELDEQIEASNETINYNDRNFEKAEMPKILENELGKVKLSYQQYDHEIATHVLIFNRKLKKAKDLLKNNTIINLSVDNDLNIFFENMTKGTFLVGNTKYTKLPNFLDPTLIKAICMQESRCGTDPDAQTDVMRVNVPGDWVSEKGLMGLKKGIIPNQCDSIKYGIAWLVAKGFDRLRYYIGNLKWESGGWNYDGVSVENITKKLEKNYAEFIVYSWSQDDWWYAVDLYNGGGVDNYMKAVKTYYNTQRSAEISDYYKDVNNYITIN